MATSVELGAAIAVAMAMTKIAEIAIGKLTNGKAARNGHCQPTECAKLVHEMHQVVKHVDEDGTPLVYYPRRMVRAAEQQLAATHRQTQLLEAVLRQLQGPGGGPGGD